MTHFAARLLPRFRDLKIAVVGDIVADQYINTEPLRLSREAPVLVVRYQSTRLIPGGAANALNNLLALGARVFPLGIVGDDAEGHALLQLFQSQGVETKGIVQSKSYRTIAKTRVMAGDPNRSKQQLLRIDHEPGAAPDAATIDRVRALARQIVPAVDGVMFSDYGYYLVTADVIGDVRAAFRGRVTAADSRYRICDFRGVTIATPNEGEAEEAGGIRIRDDEALERAGRKLLRDLGSSALLITRGNRGMALFEPGQPRLDIPATGTDEVTDVSGAGDTVIAVVTLALTAGATFPEAARLANAAAGVVVMKPGAATCSPQEFLAAAEAHV